MSRKVRCVIVGAGNMGLINARRISQDGRGEIVAVCDANAKIARQAAEKLGAEHVFANLDELFSSSLKYEAAIVSTTNNTHAPLSIALLKAGKNVYCEKPPAADLAGAKAIAAAAKKAKGVFMLGFNQRFDAWAQYAQKLIKSGQLGKVYHVQTQWTRRQWTGTFGTWFTDRKISGGGPLLDIGIHRLDQSLWMLGFPKVLSVSGVAYDLLARQESKRIKKPYTVEDFTAALLKLEGGASLILQSSYLSYLPLDVCDMRTLIMGTKSGLLESGGVLRLMTNQQPMPSDTLINHFDVPPVTPMGNFFDSLLKGKPSACTAEQGVRVMEIIDAIYRSAASGREVAL